MLVLEKNFEPQQGVFGRVRSRLFNSSDKSNVRSRSFVDRSSTAPNFMKSIGVNKKINGSTDVEKIYNMLRIAISKNDLMGAAYGSPIKEGDSLFVSSELSRGWAAKFLQLTIVGGINSGFLELDSNDIEISSSGKRIAITVS